MKQQLKPILSMVLILLVFVLGAGVWLLNDNGPEDEAGRWILESQPGVENAPPEIIPAESPTTLSPNPDNPSPVSNKPAPVSDFSHLYLIGVATDSSGPYAIILNEKINKQGLFHTGDRVDEAVILNIEADKAILKHKDHLFTLMLASVPSGGTDSDSPSPVDDPPPTYVLSDREQADIERAWEETRELMTQIEVGQNMDNDTPKGVIIQKVAEDSIFEKIGFQPGDVILQVDDMEITIADDAMEIYNCLRTKESVQFTLRRNNTTMILYYSAPNLPE